MIKPRLTVLAALLFCAGNALAVSGVPCPWIVPLALFPFALLRLGRLFGDQGNGFLRRSVVLACVPLAAYAYTSWRLPAQPDVLVLSTYKRVKLRVEVESYLKKAHSAELLCRLAAIERPSFPSHRERLLVVIRCANEPGSMAPGTELLVSGHLVVPRQANWPWDFDERDYVKRHEAVALFYVHSILHTESSVKVKAVAGTSDLVDALRRRVLANHQRLLGTESGALLTSMVIGNRAVPVPDDLAMRFQRVGLSHILAASGFNLTVVSLAVWFLTRLVSKNPYFCNASVLVCITFFVALAGSSPSVNRAALMCVVVLTARCFYRTAYLPASLSLALVLTILWQPAVIGDVGFQLSYAATTGIVTLASPLAALAKEACSRLAPWLLDAVLVTAVAELSVLPVQLFHFWQIGMLSLLANVVVSPMVPLITMLGFASSSCLLLQNPIADQAAFVLDGLVRYPLLLMSALVTWLAAFKWAWLSTGPPAIPAIVLYYAALIAASVSIYCRRYYFPAVLLFSVSFWLLFYRPPLSCELRIVTKSGESVISKDRVLQVHAGDPDSFAKIANYFAAPLRVVPSTKPVAGLAKRRESSVCVRGNDGNWYAISKHDL